MDVILHTGKCSMLSGAPGRVCHGGGRGQQERRIQRVRARLHFCLDSLMTRANQRCSRLRFLGASSRQSNAERLLRQGVDRGPVRNSTAAQSHLQRAHGKLNRNRSDEMSSPNAFPQHVPPLEKGELNSTACCKGKPLASIRLTASDSIRSCHAFSNSLLCMRAFLFLVKVPTAAAAEKPERRLGPPGDD